MSEQRPETVHPLQRVAADAIYQAGIITDLRVSSSSEVES